MIRVKRGPRGKIRRKRILKLASGYFGTRNRLFRVAKETVQRALCYAYRDRKCRKRNYRKLWIIRINAYVRKHDLNYNNFIFLLKKSNILLNRKTLAYMIIKYPTSIDNLINTIKCA